MHTELMKYNASFITLNTFYTLLTFLKLLCLKHQSLFFMLIKPGTLDKEYNKERLDG